MEQPVSTLRILFCLLLLLLGGTVPGRAQTVIRDSAPAPRPPSAAPARAGADTTRARADTGGRPGARPDSAARPAAPAVPAAPPAPPAPTVEALPKGVCTDPAGGVSTDVLLITFRARSQPAEREAALKAVHGTIVASDPTDDASAYARFPSDDNEFALRAIADRLIRIPVVKEIGPVQCPASP